MTAVGDYYNLGSEFNARMNGNNQRTADGKIPTPTVGHKGQSGSDPAFSDNVDHIVTVIEVDTNDDRTKITRQCNCGLEWTTKERTKNTERRNVFENKEI